MYDFGKIGFDPGHYAGANAGPGMYREGDVMLDMGFALQDEYDCYLTRSNGINLDLKARAVKAKALGCNMLISLHTNAPEAAKGIIVFYSVQRPEDKVLAERLGQELSKATGIAFRAAKTRTFAKDPNTDYYGIIRESIRQGIMHAFIVEHGSHWEFAVDTGTKIKTCVGCYGRVLGLEGKVKYYIKNNVDAPVVKLNSKSDIVKYLQEELNAAGFPCGVADGIFGAKTDKAVKLYQKACGLVQDGIVGTKTWAALLNVHVVELDPKMLKAGLVSSAGAEIAESVKNFINANFFSGKKTIGWLISEGKILSGRDEYKTWAGNPKGSFIVYKDGRVEVGLKYDSDIAPIVDTIQFCCQGFNLFPVNLAKEGWGIDVGRICNSLMIGYSETIGKVIIVCRQGTGAERASRTMEQLGCKKAIRLDSGGSVNLWVDGRAIFSTSRALTNIVHW